MRVNIEKMQQDMRFESRRFTLQLISALAAALGAGVALGVWVTHLGHG